ncbi:MAG TPA: glycosyltransferase [Stellaceae bacterium]|nr:glycosyltransferase [Stellaceae bacterium]
MSDIPLLLAALALAIWLYLLFARGFFWLPRIAPPAPPPGSWPSVAVVVPARDEAAAIAQSIGSLLAQDYVGPFSVVLVDDHSSDGTAALARAAAAASGRAQCLTVIAARPLPRGWTGKMWALAEGVRSLEETGRPAELLLFTDADIAHHPGNVSELVARLEEKGRDLVSLMALLRCRSAAERWLIPAFVFFFAMLYPFAWANDPRKQIAAAAGGCILVRRSAYERSGGHAAIRSALIDDCALARRVKAGGPIWIGLTRQVRSLRPYPSIAELWRMVARTAFTQLGYSPWLLLGTVLGLGLTFLAPSLLLLAGGAVAWIAGAAWLAMAVAYAPMLRFYGVSPLRAPLLPAVAAIYLAATLDSARRHWRGVGGAWKGRVQWQSQR